MDPYFLMLAPRAKPFVIWSAWAVEMDFALLWVLA